MGAAHHREMAEYNRSLPRRVFVPDATADDRYLRATWHPERGVITVSQWCDNVCVEALDLRVEDTAALIGLLATALGEAVGAVRDTGGEPEPPPSPIRLLK